MRCVFCESCCKEFWAYSADWEKAHSNESELWSGQSDEARQLIAQARALLDAEPETALRLYREAAETGSVWAMEMAGWMYDKGKGIPADFGQAQEYYRRALSAGSWMATLRYAWLLERHGYDDYWPGVLEDGVQAEFIPAYFWLGWFRYKRAKTAKERRATRPLLEHAAAAGHPGAEAVLVRSLLLGRFGILGVLEGIKLYPTHVARRIREISKAEVKSSPSGAAT